MFDGVLRHRVFACLCRKKEADEGLKRKGYDVKGRKKGRRRNKEKKRKGGIVK